MYRKKILKSLSTSNVFPNKRSGSVEAGASVGTTKKEFKFSEPCYSPLNKDAKFDKEILKKWKEKRTIAPPSRRGFHTSLIYKNFLYIFGGKDITEKKLGDIMRIDLDENQPKWEQVTPSNNITLEPIAFHSGTLVNNKYYIIGGNDASMRQSPFVYIYDLENSTLEKTEIPNNSDTCYLAMHSADYYQEKKSIILFGGYSKGKLLNTVYQYNIETKEYIKINCKGQDETAKNGNINNKENEEIQKVQESQNSQKDEELDNKIKKNKKNENSLYEESEIELGNNSLPAPRTGHSSFIKDNNLFIFGGSLKDGSLLNDIWKLDLVNLNWIKLFPTSEIEEKILKGEEDNKSLIPSPRSGQSLVIIPETSDIYIFGGRIGSLSESNDLWKYDISSNHFTLLHDTMLEQFTEEEMKEFASSEKNQRENKTKFHFITKKELDDRKNPFSKLYQQKNNKGKKVMIKSQSVRDITRNDYEKEIFVNPGYYKMKHSSIFNLDNKGVSEAIMNLDMILPYKIGDKGIKVPLPRNGHSLDVFNNQLVVFGGDRNKYPFNDLYFFSL